MATSSVVVQPQEEPANSYELQQPNPTSLGIAEPNVQGTDSNGSPSTNTETPLTAHPVESAGNAVQSPPATVSVIPSEQRQNTSVVGPGETQTTVVVPPGPVSEVEPNITKAYRKILGLAMVATIPLVVLISVFLGILQANTIHHTTRDILVRFQATRLLAPLQIAAIIAPFTMGILMKLWAYHVGRRYAEERGSTTLSRPEPLQHAMLIEYLLFPGGLTTIKAIRYILTPLEGGPLLNSKIGRIFPIDGRIRLMPKLQNAITILCFSAFFCFGLSLLVTVIQAMASVENYEKVTTIRENLGSFGRELPPNCNETYTGEIDGTEVIYSCSLKPGPGGWLHAEPAEAAKTLNNVSSINSILWDNQNEIAFLAPTVVNRYSDFKAATVGIHSSCTPKGKACQLQGDISNRTAYQTCPGLEFEDEEKPTSSLDLSQAIARAVNFTEKGVENPFHYWVWAIVQVDPSSLLLEDEDVVPLNNSISILFDCTIFIFNYTYAFTNGTLNLNNVSSSFSGPSNTKLVENPAAEVIIDPLTVGFGMDDIYHRLLTYTASFSSATAVAESTGRSVSETALAYAAGLFVMTEALAQSSREDILVTRLSTVLVVLCSLFGLIIVIEGLLLAMLAVIDVRTERGAVRELNGMSLKALVENNSR